MDEEIAIPGNVSSSNMAGGKNGIATKSRNVAGTIVNARSEPSTT